MPPTPSKPTRAFRPSWSAHVAWRDFLPAPTTVDATERLRAAAGALLGVLLAGVLGRVLIGGGVGGGGAALPWLVAPIGASGCAAAFGVAGRRLRFRS